MLQVGLNSLKNSTSLKFCAKILASDGGQPKYWESQILSSVLDEKIARVP